MKVKDMNIKIEQQTLDDIIKQLRQYPVDKVTGGYLTGIVENDTIIVEGVRIPEQKSYELYTHWDGKTSAEALQAILEEGRRPVGLVQYRPQVANEHLKSYTGVPLQHLEFKPCIKLVVNKNGKYEIFQ